MPKKLWFVLLAGILISTLVAACSGGAGQPVLQMAPESQLPAEVKDAPANVREAYRFAIANQELLEQFPCFCGCVAEGHTSNLSCYVAEDGGSGAAPKFDSHALGCGICVDITRDVMSMVQEGKGVEAMHAIVLERYGSFGPSTDGER